MKIKKVDDKPMVIHTKEKAKIHAHEPKGAKIKGSNIYTVERGPKVHDAKANEMDKKASAKLMLQKSAGGKRTYRKSTIHQSEAKDKGLSRFKRNIRESGTSIKTKNTNLHIAGRTGALAAGAVTEQVEGGQEISQAAYLAYEASRPVTGTASKGAALFRKKAAAEARKRIKKVDAGKKLAKKTAKKAAKDTAKTVAKETAKETAKTTAKVATKTATKAAATAAGTAVAPGVGTAIGMAAGYAAGVSIEVTGTKDVEETDADGNVTTVTKSVLYVNVTLKSYRDMISVYGFNSDHVEMLEQIMSPEFMGQLGYAGSGSGGGGGSPGVSSMTEDEINAILSGITDSRQKTVCSYALHRVGFPYSQDLRDSGNYYDCSSLAYHQSPLCQLLLNYQLPNTHGELH